ncbi:MAG: hypothetical protein OEY01_07620 [Desulfobulbaceae bacterium]|nr:hypothetical protein [Desulfobulbaceae bacterium]HIJ78922.1 hypothetical protein [Deltaproteobacteria bacterium]
MIKTTTKTRQLSDVLVINGIGTDILQGTAVGISAMTIGVIGAWSVSCLVAAVLVAGGPLALVTSWFQAISGI